MSLRYEMNVGIPSTYGCKVAEKPRDLQTKVKSRQIEKPILRVKQNE